MKQQEQTDDRVFIQDCTVLYYYNPVRCHMKQIDITKMKGRKRQKKKKRKKRENKINGEKDEVTFPVNENTCSATRSPVTTSLPFPFY